MTMRASLRLLDTEEISEIDTLYRGQITPDQHENLFYTLWHYKETVDRMRQEVMEARMKRYKYRCSSCGHFAKYYSNSCQQCAYEGGYSGSFSREDLEKFCTEST
jgi:lipopolysaccharide biosynthesis regulator YciM